MTLISSPPSRVVLQALLATPCGKTGKTDVQLTVVDRDRGAKGHKPLTCSDESHDCCTTLAGLGGTTDDIDLFLEVMTHHPNVTVGVSPSASLLILDFDSKLAWTAFLRATRLRPREHVIVSSPGQGRLHLYLAVSHPITTGIRQPEDVDVRYDGHGRWQYVVAPGAVRGDGGQYQLVSGTWGEWGEATEAVLDYLTPAPVSAPNPTPCGKTGKTTYITLPDSLAARALDALTERQESRKWKSRSEMAYSAMNTLLRFGLAPAGIYAFALEHRHPMLEKVWSADGYSEANTTRQAEKAAAGLTYETERVVYSATLTRAFLLVKLGGDEEHKLLRLFDFLVAQHNLHQKDVIGVGRNELVERFGVSAPTASAWLDKLVQLAALELVEDYRPPRGGRQGRVRRWRVAGLVTDQQFYTNN